MSDTFRTHDGRTLQQAASDLVQREVLCCMSSIVATLAHGFAGDGSGSDLQNLAKQAYDLAAPVLDYEEAAREEGFIEADMTTGLKLHTSRFNESSGEAETFDGSWEELCAWADIEPHELEVYEHWAVANWLAEKLIAAGERVDTDFAGLNVWARTTTGQAISIDCVIERIAREMHSA